MVLTHIVMFRFLGGATEADAPVITYIPKRGFMKSIARFMGT